MKSIKKQLISSGWLLALASITFWISWYLMPDPSTTDAGHILSIVKASRSSVLNSVSIQIVSSILYLFALFIPGGNITHEKNILPGLLIFGIGAMGLCADAFFHLLAYFMTDASVNISPDVIQVMNLMQTKGLRFLVPLLLPLFSGSMMLAKGLNKNVKISLWPFTTMALSLSIGLVIILASKMHLYHGKVPALFVLSLFALGQAMMGVEIITRSRKIPATGLNAL